MNHNIFLPILMTTAIFNTYPTVEAVQAKPPQQIAQSIWKPFSSTTGGFTILMPGIPNEEQKVINTQLGSTTVYAFSVTRNNQAFYGVAYSDLPANIADNPREIDQLLSEVISSFSEVVGGKLVSQQPINLGNFPGREFRLQLAEEVVVVGRAYLVNQRLYQIVVGTDKERYLTKSIQGFFNSFQLLKGQR
jgi:hypothetical protein